MIRVGVIGLGGMGSVHGNQYRKMPDVQLHCFDRDTSKVEAYCEKFGAKAEGDLGHLLSAVDVVDVCLPTDLHLEVGLDCIASNKPLLMEKPMALTVADAQRLADAASSAGVPMMPAQVVRYFPDFRHGHNLVASGAIGTPAVARVRRGGKAPLGSEGWFQDIERSGGVLLDLAIHDFDWLRWTLGEVTSVYSQSAALRRRQTGGDYALTTLTFESGAIAHVESTWLDPAGFRTTFEVCGSEGMIEHDSREVGTLRIAKESGVVQQSPMGDLDDPYYLEIRGFLDAVANGTPPPVLPEDGIRAVAISRAAMESAKTGRSVRPY
jgi:predicted dehydrogenase